MIVDTHLHYSQAPSAQRPYGALADTNPELARHPRLLVEDLVAEVSRAPVDKVVQITNTKMGYDNRYSLEGAARYPDKVLGVIGRFDPFSPNLRERLQTYMAQPCMLGVRFTMFTRETQSWLKDRVLDPFLAVAQELDVPVQLWAPYQIAELRELAQRYPGVHFLIDHMALNCDPARPSVEVFHPWRDILDMAQEPNIWTKVSYFPEAAHSSEPYPFAQAQQRLRELYEHVGSERLVWGSNFPGVLKACTYSQALDFIRVHCDFLGAQDKQAILGGNFLQAFAKGRVQTR